MLNEKKFLVIYEDYQRSGLTVRGYCSNMGMNEAKFYYWKKKLTDQRCETKGFVPVVFEQEQLKHQQLPSRRGPDNTEQVPFYEISYPNGTSLKLSGHNTNLETLQSLLQLNFSGNV
jgi:hypothetical protein